MSDRAMIDELFHVNEVLKEQLRAADGTTLILAAMVSELCQIVVVKELANIDSLKKVFDINADRVLRTPQIASNEEAKRRLPILRNIIFGDVPEQSEI